MEPQPEVFARLIANYQNYGRLTFENSALSDFDGYRSFWTVSDQTGLGSFDRNNIGKSVSASKIIEMQVPTISPKTLLKKHSISRVDLLQVDTEGFDFEILKMLLGAGIRPHIINYEHVHLSTPDRHACISFLGELGYRMMRAGLYGVDTIALAL